MKKDMQNESYIRNAPKDALSKINSIQIKGYSKNNQTAFVPV